MIGNDIIEIERIKQSIEKYGDRFLDKLFTAREKEYCLRYADCERQFAGRFAAKEAIVKALGTGFTKEVGWKDIEIVNNERGKPLVFLSQKVLKSFGHLKVEVSISHCKQYATAVALIHPLA